MSCLKSDVSELCGSLGRHTDCHGKIKLKGTIFINSLSIHVFVKFKVFIKGFFNQVPRQDWHHPLQEVQEARGHEVQAQVQGGQQHQVHGSVHMYINKPVLSQGTGSGWRGHSSDTSASPQSPPSGASLRLTRGMCCVMWRKQTCIQNVNPISVSLIVLLFISGNKKCWLVL